MAPFDHLIVLNNDYLFLLKMMKRTGLIIPIPTVDSRFGTDHSSIIPITKLALGNIFLWQKHNDFTFAFSNVLSQTNCSV